MESKRGWHWGQGGGGGRAGRSPAVIRWWSGLTPGGPACISHVPCSSCYQDTWTPCSLRKSWKRRSWSG